MLYNYGNYILTDLRGTPAPMTLFIGDHARQRMFERGISVDEVAEAIRRGTKWREGAELHSAIRNIEVVYKVRNSDFFVITVHYR